MKGIAHLGCRLLSIYWFIQGLTMVAYSVGQGLPGLQDLRDHRFWNVGSDAYAFLFPAVIYLVAAILLWSQAARLSRILVPADSPGGQVRASDAHGIQTLIFSGIGLYLILLTLPRLIMTVYQYSLLVQQTKIPIASSLNEKSWLAELSLELLLGVGMLVGGRALSRFLLWIRNTGVRDPD